MATESLRRARELLERTLHLHVQARRLMRDMGMEPGDVREVERDGGHVLAFGYIERLDGGVRQRYIEVPITREEYASMDGATQQLVLARLGQELAEVAP